MPHSKILICLGLIWMRLVVYGQLPESASFSYEENGNFFLNSENSPLKKLRVRIQANPEINEEGLRAFAISFENPGSDTVHLANLVPIGALPSNTYISGKGNHPLSRTYLFEPGRLPVNVICPDNAWELGFAYSPGRDSASLCGFSRRDAGSVVKGQRRRFETLLFPGGSVTYKLWLIKIKGVWQEGLRYFFQQKYLFDLENFDETLFRRKDLEWIRHSYVIHLFMAWDQNYYDYDTRQFNLEEFEKKGLKLYGGDDVLGLWPTWPSLGLDARNQFDLFRDLPGGETALRNQVDQLHRLGTRFFICYNPWDESTRSEGHLSGLEKILHSTKADGVVLDTRGSSSRELQAAADDVKEGIIMYSEGMAVPKDMPGIVAGRVHNALYYPPVLNLNKFIRPSFAIFRVAELYKEKIKREFALSFFNGYGTELNLFAPGNPSWAEEQYRYLGKTTRILRENSSVFTMGIYTPLIPTNSDSIWVNQWEGPDKMIFTIFSIRPQGFSKPLFPVTIGPGFHFVDLWHHRLVDPAGRSSFHPDSTRYYIIASTDAFNASDLGTNNEGEVDCIARFPILLKATREGDELVVEASKGDQIRVWAGIPGYEKDPLMLLKGKHRLDLSQKFGNYEGDFVIQLFEKEELIDETIVSLVPGTPRRISKIPELGKSNIVPATETNKKDMVRIPAGDFVFHESHGDAFIPYPEQDVDSNFRMVSFYMDKYPVTNRRFKAFINSTGYRPIDTAGFLHHWVNGEIPKGEEEFPVVYINYEDARAFTAWAGKRLPTEIEWQYAAQTSSLREWPWVQTIPVTRKEEEITETLTQVTLIGIDSTRCNLGNGKPFKVGTYPRGANPFGLEDLSGSVWQLTNDVYKTGNYEYIILKGGSFFKPGGSWWYVQGGPRELHYRQFLLRVSPGFERNATVGFRCMRDIPKE